jgi:hypothetical protein
MMIAFSIPCPAKSGPALAVAPFLCRQGSKTLLRRKKRQITETISTNERSRAVAFPYRAPWQTFGLSVLRKARTLLGSGEEAHR